jgi:ectoine hydroxylase
MSSEMVAEYEERGFIFRPNLLTPDEVKTITDELDRIVAGGPRPGMVLEKDEQTLRTVFNPHLYSEVFERVMRHPRLLGTTEQLLGEEVYTFQQIVNTKAAFNGDIWYWHQDYPTYRADDHIPKPRMVNTLVFLDEVTHLNGPLMIVPGSQRLESDEPGESTAGTSYTLRYTTTEVIEAEVRRGGLEAPTGAAGSVIFMNPNALHASGANLSPWPRRMISLTYNGMSNKATSPSVRSRDIVYDDSQLPALEALGDDCLLVEASAR